MHRQAKLELVKIQNPDFSSFPLTPCFSLSNLLVVSKNCWKRFFQFLDIWWWTSRCASSPGGKSGFWIFTTRILPVSVTFGHKSINLKLNRSFCNVYSWYKIVQCARLRTLLLPTLIYQGKTLCQFTYWGSYIKLQNKQVTMVCYHSIKKGSWYVLISNANLLTSTGKIVNFSVCFSNHEKYGFEKK